MKRFIDKLIKYFHIHRFNKIDSIFFEQETLYTHNNLKVYCDWKIVECRCGRKERRVFEVYTADILRISFRSNSNISMLSLENKKSII
jgi:hypothetical protein